jgi:hypothetical protein
LEPSRKVELGGELESGRRVEIWEENWNLERELKSGKRVEPQKKS